MLFGDTLHPHTQAQARACAQLYAWRQGLHPALRAGTGAEELLAAGILGAGLLGRSGAGQVDGQGGKWGWWAGRGWAGWGAGWPGGNGVVRTFIH